MLRTLREPRYASLSVFMLIVAIGCVLAGTWQISRFENKVSENNALRGNDHAKPTSVTSLLPLTTSNAKAPGTDAIEYRRVIVTGTYDVAHQSVVRNRSVNDDDGYLVLTPLTTADGTLLVVRGFIASSATTTPHVPAPPSGQVTVTARLVSAETADDGAATLPSPQVESINPTQQAARLGVAVFKGYGELVGSSPGTDGLTVIPSPDLSNPAGGALEPQHFAYIIQWYLFAALAIAAPFAMARSETKQKPTGEIDAEPVPQTPEQLRAAKLADRYGR